MSDVYYRMSVSVKTTQFVQEISEGTRKKINQIPASILSTYGDCLAVISREKFRFRFISRFLRFW